MSKHTPGPWHLKKVESDSGHIVHLCPVGGDNNYSLLTTVEHDEVIFAAVFEGADARLIAAAPDLLAALQRLAKAMSVPAYDAERPNALNLAQKAIAKATGEAA